MPTRFEKSVTDRDCGHGGTPGWNSAARRFRSTAWLGCAIVLASLTVPSQSGWSADGAIRIGVYDNPPKVFIDENGRPAGFWPELTRLIAEREGFEIDWVHGSWSEGLERLERGDIDVMVDVAPNEERKKRFIFGDQTVHSSWSLIYRAKGSNIETIQDLEGKRIGALTGSINLEGEGGLRSLLEAFKIRAEIVTFDDYPAVFDALTAGTVDAGVTNRDFGNLQNARYDAQPTSIFFQPSEVRYAFSPASAHMPGLQQTFDERVRALKRDGASPYNTLLSRWLGVEVTRHERFLPDWVRQVLAGLAAAVVLVSLVLLVSEWRVRTRTRALRQSETYLSQYRRLVEGSGELCAVVDDACVYVLVNRAYANWYGREPGDVQGVHASQILGENYFEREVKPRIERCLAGEPQEYETRRPGPDGTGERTLLARYYLISDSRQVGAVFTDITDLKQAEIKLREQEENLRASRDELQVLLRTRQALINSLPAHIALLDHQAYILDVNEQWRHFGQENDYSVSGMGVGDNYIDICERAGEQSKDDAAEVAEGIRAVLSGHLETFVMEYPCHSPTRQCWFRMMVSPLAEEQPDGRKLGAVVMHVDVTERKLAELELSRLAFKDTLTGLPSRHGFEEAVSRRIDETGWQPAASIAAANIRGLHDINEVHGFSVGDELLVSVGERLREQAGHGAIVGRTGGDDFLIFLPDEEDHSPTKRLGGIGDALAEPFVLGEVTVEVSAWSGYTLFGHRQRDVRNLVREAAIALSRNREKVSGDQWTTYTEEFDLETRQRIRIVRELRRSLEQGDFELEFQPKVKLDSGDLISCEALVRWRHPEQGLLPPAEFIPVAERSQLMAPLGEWILNEACCCIGEWQRDGLAVVRVAVNVSLVQFTIGDFTGAVRRALEAHDVPASSLELEITESVFADASDILQVQVNELHDMGIRLSLDDFGTGYSSLLYLQKYPFDEIKIDKAFVQRVLQNPYSRGIIQTVLGVGAAIGADVVAEGVEDKRVRDALLNLGCRLGQGYYYSVPLAIEEFRRLLERRSPLPLAG